MTNTLENMSLSQIEQVLRNRQGEVESLRKKRDKLTMQLKEIDDQIASLVGSGDLEKRGARARNEKSLNEHIQEILKKYKKGLSLSELADAVIAAGYHSNSKNFKNVLYQNLYGADNIARDENSGKYVLANN